MTKSYSIAEARDNFTAMVRDVERASAIELTRRGKPVAVLLSVGEYRRLLEGKKTFWDAYSEFRDRRDPRWLGIEQEVFEGLRDVSSGREMRWQY